VHVALACTRSGEGSDHFGSYVCHLSLHFCTRSREGSDHFGSYVCRLSLHFCKRLFPGLESMTSWSQGNSFTVALGLSFLLYTLFFFSNFNVYFVELHLSLGFVNYVVLDCLSVFSACNHLKLHISLEWTHDFIKFSIFGIAEYCV
jgi:hypothetical protein